MQHFEHVTLVDTHPHRLNLRHRFISQARSRFPLPRSIMAKMMTRIATRRRPDKTIHAATRQRGRIAKASVLFENGSRPVIKRGTTLFHAVHRRFKDLGTGPRSSNATLMDESIQDFRNTP